MFENSNSQLRNLNNLLKCQCFNQCTMCRLGSMIPLYKLFLRTIYRGIKNSTVHIQGNIRFPCICTGELSIPLYNYRGTISLYVFLLRVVQCRVLAWILETFDQTFCWEIQVGGGGRPLILFGKEPSELFTKEHLSLY